MIFHQRFCVFPVLMRHEDSTFIFLFIFSLEDEIESRDSLLDVLVVQPSYFVEIFCFKEFFDDASAQLCITVGEIPLRQADGLTCRWILVLLDSLIGYFDV